MVMQTKSAGAGAFAQFDLSRVDSPAFVVDTARLEDNLAVLSALAQASGARILTALKAFSFWAAAPLVSRYLDGACASGLYEARLARTRYGGIVSVFSPAYRPADIDELAMLCDHVIFNSLAQLDRFAAPVRSRGKDIALRINPQTPLGEVLTYDPSAPGSRLGIPVSQFDPAMLEAVDGLHIHNLCEQGFEALQASMAAIQPVLEMAGGRLKWLNMGGGHMITAPDYDRSGLAALIKEYRTRYDLEIFLEPGMAVAFDAGILVGEILDVMENDGLNAIVDISATCHMPDVLEAPYRPALLGEAREGIEVRFGGPSCLAGDVIGRYRLDQKPAPGQRIAFLDQAHYSMVKTTTFNGVPLPSIYLWDARTDTLKLVRKFSYDDFEGRLS